MKILSKASIFTFCTLAYLTGCSTDDGESVFRSGDEADIDKPIETQVDVASGCEEITDEADKATIEEIKTKLTDVYSTLGKGDLNKAQQLSSDTKASIQTILKKYPKSCEAQLSYVAAIISDIVNNKKSWLLTRALEKLSCKEALLKKKRVI